MRHSTCIPLFLRTLKAQRRKLARMSHHEALCPLIHIQLTQTTRKGVWLIEQSGVTQSCYIQLQILLAQEGWAFRYRKAFYASQMRKMIWSEYTLLDTFWSSELCWNYFILIGHAPKQRLPLSAVVTTSCIYVSYARWHGSSLLRLRRTSVLNRIISCMSALMTSVLCYPFGGTVLQKSWLFSQLFCFARNKIIILGFFCSAEHIWLEVW